VILRRLLVAVLVVGAMTGCSTPPAVTPEPSTTSAPTLEVAERPASVFKVGCDDVLDLDVKARLVGAEATSVAGAVWATSRSAAIIQNGGLYCEWEKATEFEPSIVVAALSDVDTDFAAVLAEYSAHGYPNRPYEVVNGLGDGAALRCEGRGSDYRGIICHWVGLLDDVGVSIWIRGLPDSAVVDPEPDPLADTSLPPVVPIVEGSDQFALVSGLLSRLATASRVVLEEPAPTSPPTCDALTADEVASALGVPVSRAGTSSERFSTWGPSGAWIQTLAGERLGVDQCSFSIEGGGATTATVTIWPLIGWALADNPTGPVEGFGRLEGSDLVGVIDYCGSDEGGSGCSISFETEGDLVTVAVTETPTDPGIPIRIASDLLD
jgi:hypothetical protein